MSRRQVGNGVKPLIAVTLCMIWLIGSGCRRDEPKSGPPPRRGSATRAADSAPSVTTDPATGGPIAAEQEDDPDAPRALPRADELPGWVRHRVQVARGGELTRLIRDPARRPAIESFRLGLAARCTYELGEVKAEALLIEADTPDDAFGAFSVLRSGQAEWDRPDGSIRAVEASAGRRTMFGWQGKTYVEVLCTGRLDESSQQSCDRLFGRIMFNVPAADPPLLLRVVPRDRLTGAKVWMVRSTAALAATGAKELENLDAGDTDARLGLTGDELLSVAAVQVADDERPNLIWLAHYAKPADAAAAHKRCESSLQSPKTDLDRNTIISEPKGSFLAGSWTADQESIRPLLPPLLEALPQ